MDERLYDHTKDGPPRTRIQKLIALNYILSSVAFLVVGLIGALKMPRKVFQWRTFWIILASSMISSLAWTAYLLHKDPGFPCWLLLPWGSVGKLWVWPVEDVVFYIGCTIAFYVCFRWFHQRFPLKDFASSSRIKLAFLLALSLSALFMVFFGEAAGKSITLLYAAPAILLMLHVWPQINSKQLLIFVGAITGIEVLMDWSLVSWIHYIPGMSWASGWVYLSFDALGHPYHSGVFIDYVQHRWAWIFDNPIEITPWYGLAGSAYIYMMIKSIDRFTQGWAHV